MTALQSLSMQRPQATVRSVILCPSAQCYNADQLQACQFRITEVTLNTPTIRRSMRVCLDVGIERKHVRMS